MQRRQKDPKKYPPTTTRPSPALYDFPERDINVQSKSVLEDIREQLRSAFEEMEHHRLTSDLQIQKRVLLEQQLKSARQQCEENRIQNQQLRKEFSKLLKKYNRIKEKKECDKCKGQEQTTLKLQKQRQIYANDRKIMQDQIKSLKIELQNSETVQERDRLLVLTDSLRKQLHLSNKKIDQQARIMIFLNDKLSQFQIQNLEIVKKVELLEDKLSQVQIDSMIQKRRGCLHCENRGKRKGDDTKSNASLSRQRRNGSIQNVKRSDRQEFTSQLQRYEP